MPKRHRTVDRVTTILEYAVATPGGVTLAELARILQAPKSSVHGLVQGLLAVGYLREQDGRFVGGAGVQALTGVLHLPELVRAARDQLGQLARLSGETTMLGARVGNSIMYQAEASSERRIRYVPSLLERRPLFTTALGRVFLADLSRPELEALIESEQPQVSVPQLRKTLAQIRETGVSYNHGESVPELWAVAVAIRSRSQELIAGLTIAGPSERMDGRLDTIAESLLKATAAITAALPN